MSFGEGGDDDPLELDLDYNWNKPAEAEKPPPRAATPHPLPDPAFGSDDEDSLDLEPLDLGATPIADAPPATAPVHVTNPPEVAPPPIDDLAPPPRAAEAFACPKCSFPQPPSDTCVACGVIFAKIKAGRAPSLAGAAPPAPLAPEVPVLAGTPVEPPPAEAEPVSVPQPQAGTIGQCLVAPFNGMGALWLLILTLVLVLASWSRGLRGLLLKFAYIGLLANYFAKCAGQAYDGDYTAPRLEKPNDYKGELVLPGLALIGLAILLWLPSGLMLGSIVADALTPTVALDDSEPLEERIAGWNPDEVFRFPDGDYRTLSFDDPPAIVKRSDGNWVKVIPEEGILLVIGEDYEPSRGDPFGDSLYGADGELAMDETYDEDEAFAKAWEALDIPVGKLLLLFLFGLFALYYWPMGLAVAAFGESIGRIYNPVVVIGCAVRAGLPYLIVVGAGFAIILVATLIASQLSWMLATFVTLLSVAYNSGAQGYLMGRLVASDAQLEAAIRGE
ncbi:MAG: hypothetical protein RMA76_00765 [Deltaproteobacteria bacterium]|jgi:hypothetical protein